MCSVLYLSQLVPFSITTYHRVCNYSNMTGATCGAGTAYPSGAAKFTAGFSGDPVAESLVFCVLFCRSLFIVCPFSFGHCVVLSFDLRLLITHFGIFKPFLWMGTKVNASSIPKCDEVYSVQLCRVTNSKTWFPSFTPMSSTNNDVKHQLIHISFWISLILNKENCFFVWRHCLVDISPFQMVLYTV